MSLEVTILEQTVYVNINEDETIAATLIANDEIGQAGIQFQDEGVSLGNQGDATIVDFTGNGVTASRVGSKVTVNVSGGGSGGSGDVTGPTASTTDNIATFNGATGKIIKDGGLKISDLVPTSRTINGIDLSANRTIPGNESTLFTRSGRYMSNNLTAGSDTTIVIGANSLRASPLVISKPVTITEIVTAVANPIALTTYRLGIYSDSGGYPDALIAGSDVGTYDSSVSGQKSSGVISISLTPGLYWIAINSNGGPTLRGWLTTQQASVIGQSGVTSASDADNRWTVTFAYAAMPTNFPAGGAAVAANNVRIGFLI